MTAHLRPRKKVETRSVSKAPRSAKQPRRSKTPPSSTAPIANKAERSTRTVEERSGATRSAQTRKTTRSKVSNDEVSKAQAIAVAERATEIRNRINALQINAEDRPIRQGQPQRQFVRLKRDWLGAILFVASGGALVAADLPLRNVLKAPLDTKLPLPTPPETPAPKKAPPTSIAIPATPQLMQGVYVTGSTGIAAGQSEHIVHRATPITHEPFGIAGPTASIGLGYRKALGDWMIGLEADHSWAAVKGTTSGPSTAPCSASIISRSGECETMLRAFSTVRLVVGRNLSFAMLYVTGGFAWGTVTGERAYAEDRSRHRGWSVGLGVEMPLTETLSVKAEYLHLNLGSRPSYFDLCGCRRYQVSTQTNLFRVGMNYSF